jgi:hypothetical protein
MTTKKAPLCVGDRVHRPELGTGTVVPSGPYFDQPFQVRLDDGRYVSSVEEDGSMPYIPGVWSRIP